MSFRLVSFKVNSILMENVRKTRVALPFNATLGDRDGRGVSAATLFYMYKFRPGTLTVHAKQVNKQRYYSFLKLQNKFFFFCKVCLGLKIMFEIMFETKKFDCLLNIIK